MTLACPPQGIWVLPRARGPARSFGPGFHICTMARTIKKRMILTCEKSVCTSKIQNECKNETSTALLHRSLKKKQESHSWNPSSGERRESLCGRVAGQVVHRQADDRQKNKATLSPFIPSPKHPSFCIVCHLNHRLKSYLLLSQHTGVQTPCLICRCE